MIKTISDSGEKIVDVSHLGVKLGEVSLCGAHLGHIFSILDGNIEIILVIEQM